VLPRKTVIATFLDQKILDWESPPNFKFQVENAAAVLVGVCVYICEDGLRKRSCGYIAVIHQTCMFVSFSVYSCD